MRPGGHGLYRALDILYRFCECLLHGFHGEQQAAFVAILGGYLHRQVAGRDSARDLCGIIGFAAEPCEQRAHNHDRYRDTSAE